MVVYKITCKITNKSYIGCTKGSVEMRFRRHMGYKKDTSNSKFYKAIKEHGVDNFYFEELECASSIEEMYDKELYWINELDTVNSGYNTYSNRKLGCSNNPFDNLPNKEEIFKKISDSKLGDKNPMRINGGLKGERNGMFGKRGSEVASARKCVAISKETSEVILFDCLSHLKEHFNVTTLGMVTSRCRGNTKSDYKGYYFKYYEGYIGGQETIENIAQEKDLCE